MKALVIEDEILASKHLLRVLEEVGDISVIAVLDSIAETVEWFRSNPQPDIAFMDIHLADGSAFEIFKHADISCPIIFTTAYDEYAMKAFKVNSIDYLLKPIEPADVKAALKKLKELSGSESVKSAFDNFITSYGKTSKYRKHFLIPSKGDKLIPVQTSDLACFCINAGVVKAFSSEGKSYTFDYTLEELEEMLDPDMFFRANRQYIISRTAIIDIDLWFNSRLSVNLKIPVPDKILISKARIGEFKNWFGK
ncbi:MAG TPA: DNA-binding response regulator [Bacteroidales bacterium]|nr:DNA-binding response regulator [Bacteroidales bacterium]HBZ20124.1 DNA-binding response regulator [Bacteroidales bacterium]